MKRFGMVALLAASILYVGGTSGSAAQKDKDAPTIKEIMKAVNNPGTLCKDLGGLVKAKEPKWDDIATKAKELVPLAKALGKNKPPKGDDESWKKFTTAYAEAAEKLEKAAKDKDAAAALAAHKVIANCGGCHGAHKGK